MLVSTPRAGSTWVAAMLGAAPGVSVLFEPFNPRASYGLRHVDPDLPWYLYLTHGHTGAYESFLADLLGSRRPNLSDLLDSRSGRRMMLREFLANFIRRSRHTRLLVKDPFASFSAEWLARRFDMRVVVLVRHPAGYVDSLLRKGWGVDMRNLLSQAALMRDHLEPYREEIEAQVRARDPLEAATLVWRMINGHLHASLRHHSDWLYVRHMDLCREPLNAFGRLYDDLDLTMSSRARESIKRHSYGEGERRIQRDSAGVAHQWKRTLTSEQIDRVRRLTADIADVFFTDEDW